MRISDWSSDVCSSDLDEGEPDSSAGVPVVKRLLLREQKTSSPFFREQHKNIGRMSIVAENEATIGELRLDALILSRSEEHTSELQSLMRISYAVFCLKKKMNNTNIET